MEGVVGVGGGGGGGGMSKPEGERWLEIAERLLSVRDLAGSKKFAARAHESDPNLEGVDQIVTVADVLIAAEKRINNHMDWYAILQLDHRTEDLEYMKRQFRRLALLLHPDKNKSPFADNAFKLVSDAYTVLSDPSKKNLYDNELNLFLKFDPVSLNNNNHHNPQTQTQQQAQTQQAPTQQQPQQQQQETTPVRRSTREKRKAGRTAAGSGGGGGGGGSGTGQNNTHPPKADTRAPLSGPGQSKMSSFWTACPYCYNLYEYPRVYEECCLRCQNCRRAFHAAVIPSPPPIVPGEDAYYCCWAFFPLGYQVPSSGGGGNKNTSTPNWTPFSAMYPVPGGQPGGGGGGGPKYGSDKDDDDVMDVSDGSWDSDAEDGSRKKGKSADHVKKNASGSRITRSTQGARLNKADGNVSVQGTQDGAVVRGYEGTVGAQKNMKKRAVAKKSVKQYGKAGPVPEIVDLNAAVKNEDDPSHMGEGGVAVGGNEDPIAGIGFFEGLDEILGHLGGLPILSVPEVQKATEGAQ